MEMGRKSKKKYFIVVVVACRYQDGSIIMAFEIFFILLSSENPQAASRMENSSVSVLYIECQTT